MLTDRFVFCSLEDMQRGYGAKEDGKGNCCGEGRIKFVQCVTSSWGNKAVFVRGDSLDAGGKDQGDGVAGECRMGVGMTSNNYKLCSQKHACWDCCRGR
jgi:hypothetical protein